jgi:protein-S-isoprenylcysteine O-methyltransferase Ste14
MTALLFAIGATVAAVLLALLGLTLIIPSLRIWPTPGPGSWQSYVFWPLFRSLNALCFAVALVGGAGCLGLPAGLRVAALVVLALSLGAFLFSFRVLGRDNSYGAQDGLVTSGIYRWSRNPQNAMLAVVYACLAVSADGAPAYLLCAAMMTVYVLMVFAEEPWLEAAYGDDYRRYRSRVPRFFNWGRAASLVHVMLRRAKPRLSARG